MTNDSNRPQKKLGLSLRGGGTRSIAYAGFIKLLEEEGIKIDYLVGSSGGSIVAGAYAAGCKPEVIKKHFENFKPLRTSFSSLRHLKPIDHQKWIDYAKLLVGNINIENMQIKLWLQATNIRTENVDYLGMGPAAEATVASSAIPFLVGPVEFNGQQYIDSEFDPETGADFLRKQGADVVIVLKSTSGISFGKISEKFMTPINILMRNAYKMDLKLHKPDLLINGFGRGSGIFDTYKTDKLFEQGYRIGKKHVPKIKKLLYDL